MAATEDRPPVTAWLHAKGGELALDGEDFHASAQRIFQANSYAFSAFMDCTIAASRALGRGVVPTVIVLLGSCVFRVLWVMTVFAYFHTITSLYLLYICSWAITAIAELVYFRGILRKLLPEVRILCLAIS